MLYVISVRSVITQIIFHNYSKIKGVSYDFLSLEKTMTFHDVTFHEKSNCCYRIDILGQFFQELMLIRQANQKSVILVTICIF